MGRQELGAVFQRVCLDAVAPQGTPDIKVPFLISRSPSETTPKIIAFQKCLYASLSSRGDSSETLNSERCYAAVVTASDLQKPGGYVPTSSTLQKESA